MVIKDETRGNERPPSGLNALVEASAPVLLEDASLLQLIATAVARVDELCQAPAESGEAELELLDASFALHRAAAAMDGVVESGAGRAERTHSDVEAALLDHAGVIVAVNEPWEEFCRANGGDLGRCGVGVSYLAVCEETGDPVAEQVAAAIRAALRHDLPSPVRVRIPCDAPGLARYFDVLISCRFADTGEHLGATVTLSPAWERASSAPAGHPNPLLAMQAQARVMEDLYDHVIQELYSASFRLQASDEGDYREQILPAVSALDDLIRRIRLTKIKLRTPR